MKNKLLIEFAYPGNLYAAARTYRIVRMYSGQLVLERKNTDLLAGARWDVVPYKEVATVFAEDARWAQAWKSASIPLDKGRGSILDTRKVAEIPEECRGVIHQYSSRNDHAPDDEHQDVYAVRQVRGMAFTSHVPVLLPVINEAEEARILLGALYMLAQGEN